MKPQAIRELIQDFLDLLEHTSTASPTDCERALATNLDHLASAVQEAPPGSVTSDDDAPDTSAEEARALVRARFPEFGQYHAAKLIDDVDRGPVVADAVDDLADIYTELKDVAWSWDHLSEQDGLWALHEGYTSHWGWHLRGLQAYLNLRAQAQTNTNRM